MSEELKMCPFCAAEHDRLRAALERAESYAQIIVDIGPKRLRNTSQELLDLISNALKGEG